MAVEAVPIQDVYKRQLKIQSGQEEQLAKQIKKDLTDLEEKIVSGGNLEITENSLVIRLQQIEKIEDQQKRSQDLEKEAERKKKGYLTASQKRTEIKEILNKMEQAYLDAQAGVQMCIRDSIYDLCNDDRYDQVKYNLQKFKKWRKDAFFFVVF